MCHGTRGTCHGTCHHAKNLCHGDTCHTTSLLPTTDVSVIVRPVTKQACFLCHRACTSVVRERTCQDQWKFHVCNCCIIVLWSGRHRSGDLLLRVKLHLLQTLHFTTLLVVFGVSFVSKNIFAAGGSDGKGKDGNFFSKKKIPRHVLSVS